MKLNKTRLLLVSINCKIAFLFENYIHIPTRFKSIFLKKKKSIFLIAKYKVCKNK